MQFLLVEITVLNLVHTIAPVLVVLHGEIDLCFPAGNLACGVLLYFPRSLYLIDHLDSIPNISKVDHLMLRD